MKRFAIKGLAALAAVVALCMFFAFYGLTIGFMVCAKKGWMPPILAAVVPDIVFFAIGCELFRRQR